MIPSGAIDRRLGVNGCEGPNVDEDVHPRNETSFRGVSTNSLRDGEDKRCVRVGRWMRGDTTEEQSQERIGHHCGRSMNKKTLLLLLPPGPPHSRTVDIPRLVK